MDFQNFQSNEIILMQEEDDDNEVDMQVSVLRQLNVSPPLFMKQMGLIDWLILETEPFWLSRGSPIGNRWGRSIQ